jgi:hypothetical protein
MCLQVAAEGFLAKVSEIEAKSQPTDDDAINLSLLKNALQAFLRGTLGDGPCGLVKQCF